jgi:hypothetical protein
MGSFQLVLAQQTLKSLRLLVSLKSPKSVPPVLLPLFPVAGKLSVFQTLFAFHLTATPVPPLILHPLLQLLPIIPPCSKIAPVSLLLKPLAQF